MERVVDVIAPRNAFDLFLKVMALITSFTAFDYFVNQTAGSLLEAGAAVEAVITIFIAAPFGVFVMAVMAAQRRLKERLRYLAEIDHLTGLLNRQAFLACAHKKLQEKPCSTVLMIDVDHFKSINDEYGHFTGDAALRRVGKHLTENTRAGDIVGRLGGEEFAILLVDSDRDKAETVAGRICQKIKIDEIEDTCRNAVVFDLTMSVGGVIAHPEQNLTELIRIADGALYTAKSTGRARAVFFERGLQ